MKKQINPLPKNAQRVFKGQIFEVWQWPQKMYDGSIRIFERVKRPNTVQIIPVVGDKILIQTQEQPDRPGPFFSFPGGRCNWDEDPVVAGQRELLEETGYISASWHLWSERRPITKMEWIVYTFIARHCKKQHEPHPDSGEKITNRLISFEEFLKLPNDPSFCDVALAVTLLKAQHDPVAARNLRALLFK